jgi:rhodanese-related sulfurtransferase
MLVFTMESTMIRLSLLIFVLSLSACASPRGEKTSLSPTKADSLIRASANDSSFHLIDIRTPQEYGSGKIGNARMIDFYAPDFQANLGKLPRDAKILIYCRSGNRTGQALGLMESMGFTDVRHLAGGIGAWRASGLPLTP